MSDEAKNPSAPPAKSRSGVRRKLALMIMAGIIVVQGGVAGTWFLLFADSKGSVPEVPAPAAGHAEDGHGAGHGGHDDAHGGHDDHGHGAAHDPAHEEPAADHGGHGGHDAHGGHGAAHGGHGAAPGPGQVEVDLGEFSVSSYQEARGRTLFVSFHLYALLPSAKEGMMLSQFEAQKHRIRERVLVLFRGATLEDLSEPELGSLKGQTLETINASLSKPMIEEVMFSDFVIVEQ